MVDQPGNYGVEPDEESIAARAVDLRDYIGPNAEKFLRKYQRITPDMLERSTTGEKAERKIYAKEVQRALRGWVWPALLVPMAWFLYRKMYVWAVASFVFPIITFLVIPSASEGTFIGFAVFLAFYAYNAYHQQILSAIKKADDAELRGKDRSDYLARAGGVSVPGAVLGGVIMAAEFAAAILVSTGWA